MEERSRTFIFRILQLAAFTVFLGRAYQHLFWDVPYRSLLWDEGLLRPLVESWFGVSWEDYVTNLSVDRSIVLVKQIVGGFLLLCAALVALGKKTPVYLRWTWLLGAFFLAVQALLIWKEKFYNAGQLMEYTLQVGSPVFFYWLLRRKGDLRADMLWVFRIAIALTFIGHGLYAIGYYPRPGYFIFMVMRSLDVSDTFAVELLTVAGVADFIVALLILLPVRSLVVIGLSYCVIWGFLTTLARIWAYWTLNFWWDSLHQWGYETVFRFPHFLVPLAVLGWFLGEKWKR